MRKKPLLSICIPTYNRAEYLEKSLETLVKQKEFNSDLVEVVISDNCSDDNTEEIVKAYANKYDNIIYNKNKTNVDNMNYIIAFSKATGIYRKLVNDSYMYSENALNLMINTIKSNMIDRPYIYWSNGGYDKKCTLLKYDFEKFVVSFNYRITAIICFGLWEDDCEDLSDPEGALQKLFWQVYKLLDVIYKKDRVVVSYDKIFIGQKIYKKDISYGLWHVFYENFMSLLDKYFINESLTNNDKEKIEKSLLFGFFRGWVIDSQLEKDFYKFSDSENLKQEVYNHYHSKSYWSEYLIKYYYLYIKKIVRKYVKKFLNKK